MVNDSDFLFLYANYNFLSTASNPLISTATNPLIISNTPPQEGASTSLMPILDTIE